jgi:hypothetical protein
MNNKGGIPLDTLMPCKCSRINHAHCMVNYKIIVTTYISDVLLQLAVDKVI